MPFEIIRNDITAMKADAIVNAAGRLPEIGFGVERAIHQRAGLRLLAAREKIGALPYGDAAITPAFGLDAKYVIHAATPVWQDGTKNEQALLDRCYTLALELALKHRCRSIAFPLLGAGSHGFPGDLALQTAIGAFSRFLTSHEMQIWLVVFDRSAYTLSEKLFRDISSYIDETYVMEKQMEEFCVTGTLEDAMERRRRAAAAYAKQERMICGSAPAPCAAAGLDDLLKNLDESFSEALLRLIDKKGLKDPQVYKRANIDRKHFSKIKNNKGYKPGKATCVAFAIALELNLDETKDLLGKAGYALTHSSKFDIIIEYFILQKNYDCFEINEVLFAFDQPLIGG